MYLSDRDIRWAVEKGTLIIQPAPKVDPTSVDLRLDRVEEARIWDTVKLLEQSRISGCGEPEVHLGKFHYAAFSEEYLTQPAEYRRGEIGDKVCRRGNEIIVRPNGFLLWQTKEVVGTPLDNAQYICFVD